MVLFFYGNFNNGFYHGQGVIVTPYNGYLTGCWSNGIYIGNCSNINRYDNDNEVEDLVNNVQSEKPNNSNYSSISPEGYKIKKIEPETKMGKTLLGKYKGN